MNKKSTNVDIIDRLLLQFDYVQGKFSKSFRQPTLSGLA